MKILLALLAVACAAPGLLAQTNTYHYTPKSADMRIVEGKMYNRVLSTNWTTLPSAGTTLEVLAVIPDGAFVQSHKDGKAGDKLMIKHCPDSNKLAKGQTITNPFRAMQVADVKFENGTVAAYDCGVANTKENRKALVNCPIHGAE